MSNVRLYPPRGLIVTPNGAATQEMAIYLQQVVRAINGASYTHTQTAAATVWTINHDLGFYPAVVAHDASGNEISGTIANPSVNQTTITFGGAQSGTARLT